MLFVTLGTYIFPFKYPGLLLTLTPGVEGETLTNVQFPEPGTVFPLASNRSPSGSFVKLFPRRTLFGFPVTLRRS